MSDTLDITENKLKVTAITYENGSSPLKVSEVDLPVQEKTIVKPTEVLVQVKATSLNPVDTILKQFSNSYFGPKQKIIGGDFSGIVVKAGDKTSLKVGDKVYGDLLTLTKQGSCSNFVIFEPEKILVCEKIPDNMSFEQAASLPCVSNTAFQALKKYSGNLKDKNVLVLGAGTAVGCFSVQFARHYFEAANVVATCSSKSTEKTEKSGATLTVDYTKGEQFKYDQLLGFVKSHGKFDLIVDCVRDESVMDHFDSLLKPATEQGVFAQVTGSYLLDYSDVKLSNLLPSWKRISSGFKTSFGFSKYAYAPVRTSRDAEYGSAIAKLWKEKKLEIFFDSQYDAYTGFKEAFDRVASCSAQGKVILKF
ncbi:hypothetical protein PICMEDRAFT_17492 [Pichia membranifaciens NRRL Y-2026]|uniref:Enoyl reductase (ER) domain-containing protein n=1 Tax=Pichia membranifaciens NRRL Y-2026 TaxID=763406 RepID=A0A1E3NFT6_9ASCO|nr:hypothetical protein PICMEDRAFT_17492 [Pichia membranifaciens NRRL Y-2026]ODQ44989.1 hypothetical protein PICMEDRAFT_17492 [Pichia membranifaciens NRRL Y-2026]